MEGRLARVSKESEAEGARLRKAIAVAVAERDAALQKAREKAREELEAEWEGRGRAEVAEKVARVTADAERVTSRKLEEAVVRGKEETRRAVEAAEMRKDREMAKALKVWCCPAVSCSVECKKYRLPSRVETFVVGVFQLKETDKVPGIYAYIYIYVIFWLLLCNYFVFYFIFGSSLCFS